MATAVGTAAGRWRAVAFPAIALSLLPLHVAPAAGQADTTVVVVAGAEYDAGGTKRMLLGDDYRDLWTTPIRVPVLDLASFAGGLTPVERGGGQQTKVLHMRNPEGREFVFRSVNKDPALADEPALIDTPISAIVQDQVSSLHPAGALVVARLLEAVDVLHPDPVLVVMPDDPSLGEFREEFAGVLGWVEERPDEVDAGGDETRPGFAGFARIIGTDRLLERLEESPEDRVDARTFLTARLVDLVVGDWDRHHDQWRWAEREEGDVRRWIPVPRDRDYALVNYDGMVIRAASRGIPNIVEFNTSIDDLGGLLLNARDLDRRLLTELSLAEWDSVAAFVTSRLTNDVIAEAVARIPPEYAAGSGVIEAKLRGRRDDLSRAAREFYAMLASEVDVRATDEDDLAVVERVADDVLRVSIHARTGGSTAPTTEPYYSRTFYGAETNEVRVFLQGGDDLAVVRGSVNRSPAVRVIGGGGDDTMVDSAIVRIGGARTAFYDWRGDNRMIRGRGTRLDTREHLEPDSAWEITGDTFRDWGDSRSIAPVLDYRGTDGLIIGGGPVYTRYGFRRYPYDYRIGAVARLGLESLKPALEVFADFRRENSSWGYGFEAEASRLENFRFYGFGNDTRSIGERRLYTVDQDQISLRAYVDRWERDDVRVTAGPVVMYTNPDVPDGSVIGELPRYGNSGFGQMGAWLEAALDRREPRAFARRGFRLDGDAEIFPGVWSADGPFGSVNASAAGYLTPAAELPLTLAVRLGGGAAWGEFPVHESAFLGGSGSLRGYSFQRFAGEQVAYANAEVRVPLTRAVLLVRGTLGALGLADAGRVWFDGESPGGWHKSVGGGLWFEFDLRDSYYGASILYAEGAGDGRIYLSLGAPF